MVFWRTEGGGRELSTLLAQPLGMGYRTDHCSLLKCCGGEADGRNPV